ncbi:MAG: 3-methylcrotonyl-CoA carboxylase, partial [Pseudomonadota bacterium]|nr:3-methylcrotonyl-CoA carboxylase [Pseudomonadota bacterium]
PDDGAFYFLEMNTRLQVEHPVTETITGIDLVEWQVHVAAGGALPLRQEEIRSLGHAIEARLYAEDPARDFLPQAGWIARLNFPTHGAARLRIDAGVRAGDAIPADYDPMIAKVIVWDKDRRHTLLRLRAALGKTRVAGLATNLDLLRAITAHQAFTEASPDTGFIGRHTDDLLPKLQPAGNDILALAVIGLVCERAATAREQAQRSSDPWSPWTSQNGWRLNEEAHETVRLREIVPEGGGNHTVEISYPRNGWRLDLPGGTFFHASGTLAQDGTLAADLDGHCVKAVWVRSGEAILVFAGAKAAHRFELAGPVAGAETRDEPPGRLASPMPGRIAALLVAPGARVEANQPVLVLEAMKMEHMLRAPKGGILKEFKFQLGDQVGEGVELATFETKPPPEIAS